ncbi:MAG: DUF3566 domain-containing protein [Candidatus Nanopelagicales bacterium]|nr:DUF3566 domain-containing protein [Candidatus Nanopelagicales bacterium]
MSTEVTRGSGPRRARLYVTRIDPWSVAKAAFLLALTIGVVIVVAVWLLWWLLDSTGVLETLSRSLNDIVGSATTGVDLVELFSFSRVVGGALIIAAVEVILVSLLATIFAFMYNLTVGITGGLEVVLSDDL